MNNNQISNPKKEVPKGIGMNDKDYITKLLSCLKEMEKNYVVAMTEASNENLYNKYKKLLKGKGIKTSNIRKKVLCLISIFPVRLAPTMPWTELKLVVPQHQMARSSKRSLAPLVFLT